MPECKSCKATIVWVEMASGKKMPLDATPISAVQVKDGIGGVVQVYIPHWATCPSAEKHRRP